MFALTIMTVGTLAVAYTAAVLVSCSMPAFELFWTDPLDLCAAVDSVGLGADPGIGIGLAAFSALSVVATWIPVLKRRRKKKRIEPDRSLAMNLSRITPDAESRSSMDSLEQGSEETSAALSRESPEEQVDRHREIMAELEALEAELASPEGLSRSATSAWIRLLREVNDLHNDGNLPTDEFRVINTRLLDLVVKPPSLVTDSSR